MSSSTDYFWAPVNGLQFGWGWVLCHRRGHAVQVRLPEVGQTPELLATAASRTVFRHAPLQLGGPAGEMAPLLEQAIATGRDVTDLPTEELRNETLMERALLACRAIPHGETRDYGWLAAEAGNARAARAAGSAMARNPLPLIIPCHRVVRRGGDVGNYGGGAEMKRWLLQCEGALACSL